jgi:pimeloyl-ACP methyl ester carboxylesterase
MPDPAAGSHDQASARELSIAGADGVMLSGEQAGSGQPIVLLHGLTATRRYVVHGSRALERSGHRVIAYDARGHGRSTPPAPMRTRGHEQADAAGAAGAIPRGYGYEDLAGDLGAVLDAAGVASSSQEERAVLAGVSMGAHTIVRFALDHPQRVAALAIITPAYYRGMRRPEELLAGWDALARGLREGGVEGFLGAYQLDSLPESLRATVATVVRQRISAHEHPAAVADALEAVPRSRPFLELAELASIAVPTVVIASRDEADPRHPLAVGERYARAIPGAQLFVEDQGSSPLAWQGGQVSRIIGELAARAGQPSRANAD